MSGADLNIFRLVLILATLWAIAFPVIMFINADLLPTYFLVTLYTAMFLFGWAIAASMTGGFVTSGLVVLAIGVGAAVFAGQVERRYREETHGTNIGRIGRRALGESLSTYCPAWMNLAAGALAGALFGIGPAVFAILHTRFAPADRLVGPGVAAIVEMGSSMQAGLLLVSVAAAVGFIAALLRRTRGFARQMVWPITNTYIRRRPDNTAYDKFLIYWFPAVSFLAIALASQSVMGLAMKYFFAWVFSGLIFRQLWSNVHSGLLKLMGAVNDRRLDYEYLLRVRLENESALHACTYSSIIVRTNGEVELRGRFKNPESEDAARSLIETLVRKSRGKVLITAEDR